MTDWPASSQGLAAVRDFGPANVRLGSKRELAIFGLMSATAGCGHNGPNAYRCLVPDIQDHDCRQALDSLSKPAAVQDGAFSDVSPIHDQWEGMLIARVDSLGNVVARAGLGDHVLADAVEFLQHGVVEL